MLTLAFSPVLTGCPEDDEVEEDPAVPPAQTGGALSGTIYFVQAPPGEIRKLSLATGAEQKLGFGDKVQRAPDGKLIVVVNPGDLEESDESLVAKRTIKPRDRDGKDDSASYNDIRISPDGTKVAYDNLRGSFVCNRADGALLADFQKDNEGEYMRPTWTRDGRIVAAGAFGNPGLYISDAALKTMTRFDPGLDHPISPDVSPDGTKVTFTVKNLVFVINIDGTGLVQLDTDPDENDVWPAWSPDGKFIAYLAKGGFMKIRPSAGGAATDVLQTFPAIKEKLGGGFATVTPFQWTP